MAECSSLEVSSIWGNVPRGVPKNSSAVRNGEIFPEHTRVISLIIISNLK